MNQPKRRSINATVIHNSLEKTNGKVCVSLKFQDTEGTIWEKRLFITVASVKFSLETLKRAFDWDFRTRAIEEIKDPIFLDKKVELIVEQDPKNNFTESIVYVNSPKNIESNDPALTTANEIISSFINATAGF